MSGRRLNVGSVSWKLEGGKQEDGEGVIDDGMKRWRNRLEDGKVA